MAARCGRRSSRLRRSLDRREQPEHRGPQERQFLSPMRRASSHRSSRARYEGTPLGQARGSFKVKVVPSPSGLDTDRSPPIPRARSRLIARPRIPAMEIICYEMYFRWLRHICSAVYLRNSMTSPLCRGSDRQPIDVNVEVVVHSKTNDTRRLYLRPWQTIDFDAVDQERHLVCSSHN